ncbi:MAG: hypothetical protein ACXVLQ_05380 [Bacteriovorax sp.]
MNTVYISLFAYGSFLVGQTFLPESFWDHLLKFEGRTFDFFARQKKNLPMLGEIYHGEELINGISETEAKVALGLKILPKNLPRYKFYTDLLEELFETHRKQGIGLKKFIPEIRGALIRDLQFEKKIFSECMGALLQFLVIAATTWSFVFLSSSLVEIPLDKTILILMLAFEVLGAVIFFKVLHVYKKKTFLKFESAIGEIYLFTTLLEVGLPINEIQQRSKIMEGSLMMHKHFGPLAKRMRKLIDRLKESGLSLREEAQEVTLGLWQLQEDQFLQFTKKTQVLKFGILAFFFMPAYFLYLYSIFKFFMEQ